MDKLSKGDIAIFWGSYIAGGTASVPLLWTGSPNDWLMVGLKFLGLLGAGMATAFAAVIGKHLADKLIKKNKDNGSEQKKAA